MDVTILHELCESLHMNIRDKSGLANVANTSRGSYKEFLQHTVHVLHDIIYAHFPALPLHLAVYLESFILTWHCNFLARFV